MRAVLHSSLINPPDLSIFNLGLGSDCRILFLEPLLDFFRSLFRSGQLRTLTGVDPAPQIITYASNRQVDTKLTFDQFFNRRASPRRKRHFQLIWGTIDNDRLNLFLVFFRQQGFIAWGLSSMGRIQSLPASFPEFLHPIFKHAGSNIEFYGALVRRGSASIRFKIALIER